MVTCGHQFHMGDGCDWIISSSAVCPINGDSSATKFLKRLIEAHCRTRTEEPRTAHGEVGEIKSATNKLDCMEPDSSDTEESKPKKTPEFILEAREMPLERKAKSGDGTRSGYCMPVYCETEEFDENQHADGCPIKWYYRKRTKTGWGPCIALRRGAEDRGDANGKRFRDRIPLEVKIGKISLNKREPLSDFRNANGSRRQSSRSEAEKYRKFEIDPKVAEIQKKRLEAKLNWRPFQEGCEEDSEMSFDRGSRDGYLRPRSALGGKAPISILLFPYHQTNNCSCGRSNTKKAPKIRVERVSSAKNIKTPNTTEAPKPTKITRPKTTQPMRWGSKHQRKGKTLQVPKQMNVFFDEPKNLAVSKKPTERVPTSRKSNMEERMRHGSSARLSSLYYELEDKSHSCKIIDDEYLERMIRELSMEDNFRGVRGILTPGFAVKKRRCKHESRPAECRWSGEETFKIICKPIKFSQRRPKSKKLSGEDGGSYSKTSPRLAVQ